MAIAKPFEAKDIFICNTSNIDSMRHGRPQTVLIEQGAQIYKNGAIVPLTMGTKEMTDPQLDHAYALPTAHTEITEVIGKFIIVDPEINVEQYRRIHNSLAAFGEKSLEVGTHTAYELQLRDRIEYSQGYFAVANDEAQLATIIVGDVLKINNQGLLEKVGAAGTAGGCFKVVAKNEQRMPLMMDGLQGALPKPYLMFKLEVIA